MKRIAAVLSLGFFALVHSFSFAQSDGNAPLILELPSSTRALGLGNAYVLSAPDPDAVFAAPSVLSAARGVSLGVQRYSSHSTILSLSSTANWGGGVLAVGVQSLSYGTFGTTLSSIPRDADALLNAGSFSASELIMSVGYGRSIFGMQVGVVGKLIEQHMAGQRDGTAGFDVGIARNMLDITWALSAQNLGTGLMIGEKLPLPRRFTFAASSPRRAVGLLDVIGTAVITRLRDGDVVPGGGLEFSYWPIRGRTFTGRVGVRSVPDGTASQMTYRAGFSADDLAIEYAFEGFDASGSAHRFGIRWLGSFGGDSR